MKNCLLVCLLVYLLVGCKQNQAISIDGRTFIKITQTDSINFIYQPCDATIPSLKIIGDSLIERTAIDMYEYRIIDSKEDDKIIKLIVSAYTKGSDEIEFKFIKKGTKIKQISNRATISFIDSLYADTLPFIEQPCTECWDKEDCDEWARQEKEEKEKPKYIAQWQGSYSFGFGRTHMGESSEGGMRFYINGENSYYSYYNKSLNPDTGEVIASSKQDNIATKIVKVAKDTLKLQDSDGDIYKIYKDEQGYFNVSGHEIYMLNPPNESYLLTKE